MSIEVSAEVYERLLGQTLANRYLIETRLGEGAMGAVYKAKHVKVGRAFAVKLLHPRLLEDRKVLQRFEREAELAGRLRHPNVIGVVDVGETPDGMRYMVMDFAEGPDLASLLTEAPLPAQRVTNLTRQMLDGLFHAHEQGLIHRDFKPENVIVERDSHGNEIPRIVDFGIAILREGGESSGAPGRLTTNGLVLGTPHYMAPEQAGADPHDHRIDLFAMGIMVYEMLCGKLPFDGSGAEVARANLLLDPPPISKRVPYLEVDPLLEAFSRRLMAKKRDQRPPTAKAARELLDLIDKDRAAAAAALGVPREQATRAAIPTQDAQPIPRHASGDGTFPPPIRAASDPRASSDPRTSSDPRATPARQQSIATQMTEPLGVHKRRAPLVIAGVLGVGILAGAAIVLTRGGDAKPSPTPTPTVAQTEPAPITPPIAPSPTPLPPVETATQPATPPEPATPPVETLPAPQTPKSTPKTQTPRTSPRPPTTPKAGSGSAATTTPPVPTTTAAPKAVDASTLASQYQSVGAQLRDLQNTKGADATSDLWPRYRYVRITSAMATQESRDAASAILTKLASDIRARAK